jgi:hypothetical protein
MPVFNAPPQATGVIPASTHFIAPYCSEADLPTDRLEDSSGNPIADVQLGWMIAAATDLLYVLSGRQYRAGHTVCRPCAVARAFTLGSAVYPYNSLSGFGYGWGFSGGWQWSLLGLGFSQGTDSTEVVLQGPITNIESVLLDGAALGPGDYTVFDRTRMVLRSGLAWPWQQDPQMDPSQVGTAEIVYDWGQSPPEMGRLACAELAIELALSFSGQDSCRLPSRVLSIATQGVNVAVGDALTYLLTDLTGCPTVDLFLRAVNPSRRRRPTAFIGPSSVRGRTI